MSSDASRALAPRLVLSRPLPRPRLLVLGLVIVVAVLCVPIAKALNEKRNEFLTMQMQSIATRISVPAGLTTLRRGECPSQEDLVGCWTSTQAPDDLAATFTTALKQATGGEGQTRCETLPFGSRPRSCEISYNRFGHYIGISVDTSARYSNGKMVPDGSRVRIDAS